MSGTKTNGSVPSPAPPLPKSPPEYPDLYGKRRELVKLQLLEREIGFLEEILCKQEELKSVELGLQPASVPCKEVADFVTCSADPFIPFGTKKVRRSSRFWKRLWICRCSCSATNCSECSKCSSRDGCESCRDGQCFNTSKCTWNCCLPKCPCCLICCSIRCRCYPKLPKVNMCSC